MTNDRSTTRPIGGTTVLAGTASPPAARIAPGPGQESVWDCPRPPRVEPVSRRIRIIVDGVAIADTTDALRVIETAGAPVYYLPTRDVRTDLLSETSHISICEWKGQATYWDLTVGERTVARAAWSYPRPKRGFEAITDRLAFYAFAVDEAWVGDERATPQPGDFYGGWVTSDVVGPFKGEPGTERW